jgi:L-asparaginase II
VQREIKAVIESITGAAIPDERRGIDGCSVPTWAVPLKHLALGFARFGTGNTLAPERAKAAARLRAACAAHPWYVAGTGRFCTEVMQRLGARAFVKVGAEGIYCGALPERGLGIAIKCDDGGARAAEVVMAALIARFGALSEAERAALDHLARPTLRNWNGFMTGQCRIRAAMVAAATIASPACMRSPSVRGVAPGVVVDNGCTSGTCTKVATCGPPALVAPSLARQHR